MKIIWKSEPKMITWERNNILIGILEENEVRIYNKKTSTFLEMRAFKTKQQAIKFAENYIKELKE